MITNKDIRIENGNLVLNGDKYPLNGQSPEAIMEIVKDNSDTTPTENSDAPITSGGVKTAIDAITAFIPKVKDSTASGETSYDMGRNNGIYLMVVGQGGAADILGLYLVKITHYASGTNVVAIVTPTQNPPTVTATEITSNENGKITITHTGIAFHVAIYEFDMNMA